MPKVDFDRIERNLYRHPAPKGVDRFNVMSIYNAKRERLAEVSSEIAELKERYEKRYISERHYKRLVEPLQAEQHTLEAEIADLSTTDALLDAERDLKEAAQRQKVEDLQRRRQARIQRMAAEAAQYDDLIESWSWELTDLVQMEDRRAVGREFAQRIQPILEELQVIQAVRDGNPQALYDAAEAAGVDVGTWLLNHQARFPVEMSVQHPRTGRHYILSLDPDGTVWADTDTLANAFGADAADGGDGDAA